ncbi:MAG: hypothetical protein ACRCX8_01365 [Sarcina sp.]
MTQQELEQLYIETEHGTFTPNFTYDDYDLETETYTNIVIHKAAQQVYEEWASNKDKPVEPQPTQEERIVTLEQTNAKLLLEIAMLKGGL